MSNYHSDPGGVFASDTHRRTLGHLPLPGAEHDPTSVEDLFERMAPDVGTDFADEAELAEVLSDLEADGYAEKTAAGWKQTKNGQALLNAALPEED